jgi:hypothetical protein
MAASRSLAPWNLSIWRSGHGCHLSVNHSEATRRFETHDLLWQPQSLPLQIATRRTMRGAIAEASRVGCASDPTTPICSSRPSPLNARTARGRGLTSPLASPSPSPSQSSHLPCLPLEASAKGVARVSWCRSGAVLAARAGAARKPGWRWQRHHLPLLLAVGVRPVAGTRRPWPPS